VNRSNAGEIARELRQITPVPSSNSGEYRFPYLAAFIAAGVGSVRRILIDDEMPAAATPAFVVRDCGFEFDLHA